jgi:hypothetical protein
VVLLNPFLLYLKEDMWSTNRTNELECKEREVCSQMPWWDEPPPIVIFVIEQSMLAIKLIKLLANGLTNQV